MRKLVEDPNNQVRALVSSLKRSDALQGLSCEIFAGDITKPETLNAIFDVPKGSTVYVIHCAAIVYIKSKPNPQVYNVNVNGTRNIIDQTLKINAKLVDVNSVHAIPELLQMIGEATGKRVISTFLPFWLAKLTAPLSEIYYNIKKQPPLYTNYSLYTLNANANFSHAKASHDLGYSPRPMQETINDTVKWLEAH